MSAALAALFRGWWVRFYLRPKPAAPTPARVELLAKTEDTPAVALAVEPEPMAQPAIAASSSRSPLGVTRAPFIPVAQPALRASTLAKLATLQQIPSLQALAQGFLRATARSDGSIEDVVAAVEKDPALCVRVLRMANSAFVASEQRIEDVATAVQMLGLQRVNTLSHALFMMRDAHNTNGGVDWRHLWMHALATAAIAEEIEKQLGRETGQQLYLAALLHDVGKIVLSTVAPEAYRAIMDKAWNSEGRLDALETVCFGVGHSEAGVIFAQQSGLPGEVITGIAHHADPAQAESHRLTVAVVSLANYLAKFYGLGFSGTRLDEADGELEVQPGWAVIAGETGATPDIAGISQAVDGVVGGLKQDLLSLRDAA
ncbi:MAG: hypothetical protein QG602_3049 [Verrucomicrobiota bacterium]|nr:hypothetical protein [Verrucomicrobiota bacterium]